MLLATNKEDKKDSKKNEEDGEGADHSTEESFKRKTRTRRSVGGRNWNCAPRRPWRTWYARR